MNNRPVETVAPLNSHIAKFLDGADFADAWCIQSSRTELSALEYFLAAGKRTPRWVEMCMNLRNHTVKLVDLKNLSGLSQLSSSKPAAAYQPGERVGIFTLYENTFDETLLGDKDKHLDVFVSVHRQAGAEAGKVMVTITTVVHVKNMLGRIYMLPVKPMHRLIAPAFIRGIGVLPDAA